MSEVERAKPKNPPRPLLKFRMHCPVSNVLIDSEVVPPHTMPVILCNNGSLMGYCSKHEARCFMRDSATVGLIMRAEAPTRKLEEDHGR